jgi:hypothetical protein
MIRYDLKINNIFQFAYLFFLEGKYSRGKFCILVASNASNVSNLAHTELHSTLYICIYILKKEKTFGICIINTL